MSAGVKIVKVVKVKRALGIVFLVVLFMSVMLLVTRPTPAHAAPPTWQPWGGGLSSSPDAAWIYPADQNIVVRGNDYQLWGREGFNGNPAGDWLPLGGILTSGPAIAHPYGTFDQMDVFGRGADGALWWRGYGGMGGWGPWQSLGGIITSDPDAMGSVGAVSVFARGADNALWYRLNPGGGWESWSSLGGILTSSPGAAFDWDTGHGYVFVRGADNALWVFIAGPTIPEGGWQSLGGTLASGPDASYDDEHLMVAALGTDGAVWYRTHTGIPSSPWSEWHSLGGQGTSDPALTGSQGGGVLGMTYAFVRGTDGQLWQTEVGQ